MSTSAASTHHHASSAQAPKNKQRPYDTHSLVLRYLAFFSGLIINSFGIVFVTKGALGTSPISSTPYVLSLQFPNVSFGMFTFIMGTLFVFAQIALLRRDFQPVQFLQIPANALFSAFIDIANALLADLTTTSLPLQIGLTVFGSAVLAVGVSIEVAPNTIFVPGEGIVRAIAAVGKFRFGTTKNCFDLTLVAIALVLSFIFFGEIRGLGIGTVMAALIVGPTVNLVNAHLPLVARLRELAGSAA